MARVEMQSASPRATAWRALAIAAGWAQARSPQSRGRSTVKRTVLATALFTFALANVHAQIPAAPPLPFDSPVSMRAMEAVCTGIGADARSDPRWPTYPLRIDLVGRAGEYLGQAEVTLSQNDEAIIGVRCGGPWLLLRLPPGAYDVTAVVENVSKMGRVTVPATGQGRLVLRFPELGQEQAK
jgi:hypothetical protein